MNNEFEWSVEEYDLDGTSLVKMCTTKNNNIYGIVEYNYYSEYEVNIFYGEDEALYYSDIIYDTIENVTKLVESVINKCIENGGK